MMMFRYFIWILNKTTISIWITIILMITQITGEIVFRVDPLALLSATLRTYQRAACDTDIISLSCPRGTSISIEVAQYGKSDGNDGIRIEDLCPLEPNALKSTQDNSPPVLNGDFLSSSNSNSNSKNTNSDLKSTITTSTKNEENDTNTSNNGTTPGNCMWPNALQYSLLQTVVEACQKKKHCKFNASPGTYSGIGVNSGVGEDSSGLSNSFHSSTSISADPCPRVRKFVEIAYKCRPYEFRSKVACENDVVQLDCNPYSRIVIYSSSFGRTEYESIQCPQPQGVREETCLASYATETVMQICHGRRRCNLTADSKTFGSPCNPNSRMYLKVVYTCVPKQVLKDRYESTSEPDELEHFDGDTNELYDEDQFYKESEAIPKLQSNLTHTNSENTTITDILSTTLNSIIVQPKGMNLQDDQERLYFYLIIAGVSGVLLCIIIVIIRIIIYKRNQRNINNQTSSSPKGETTIPNGFNDSISEIDADIDLTTPVPVPSVSKNENYITYGPSSSLYGSLGPSNVSHTSSTMLLPANSLICARQSPDIIGVANTFIGQPGHVSSIGTIVPISSLAQYTTAPTYHAGYIMDPEGVLRRPISQVQHQQQSQQLQNIVIPSSSSSLSSGVHTSQQQKQHLLPAQQQSSPSSSVVVVGNINSSDPTSIGIVSGGGSGVSGIIPTPLDTFQYDGTAPRTLSTGLAHNSDFYYG